MFTTQMIGNNTSNNTKTTLLQSGFIIYTPIARICNPCLSFLNKTFIIFINQI